MIDIETTYNEEELGWVSPIMELTGDIYVECELTEKGRLTIKKSNEIDGEYPKIFITPYIYKYEGKVYGETKGKFVQFITSEEPKYLRYANI